MGARREARIRPARRRVARALAGLLAAACTLAAPAAEARGARPDLERWLAPCRVAGVDDSVWCGVFEVPEDRARTDGRRIGLRVVVVPATGDPVAEDAVAFLAGGGVVPATRFAGFLARALPELRRSRDLLLVDQRGTGGSNPLDCGSPAAVGAPSGRGPAPDSCAGSDARACLDALAGRADLRHYATHVAMDDLDAVRAALGYARLDLFAASYGTKAAQVYMRRHPERVRAAVLHGVVPLGAPTPLDLARSADDMLARAFDACAADSACAAAHPRPAADLDTVLARLAAGPREVALEPPPAGPGTVVVTDRLVRDLVQSALGSARAIERLPALLREAAAGDLRALARAWVGDGPPPPPPAPRGVYLSILCGEAVPLVDPAAIEPATRGTVFGDHAVRSQLCDCAEWPRPELPADFHRPVTASVPVLALTGALDAITPPRYGAAVADALPLGTHLVLPARSHSDVDPCVLGLIERFLLDAGMARVDPSCLGAARLRFATPGAAGPEGAR